MGNRYRELTSMQQERINRFSKDKIIFAHDNDELNEGLAELKLTADDVMQLYSGCYIRKDAVEEFKKLNENLSRELNRCIQADETGEGFVYDMFLACMEDHNTRETEDPTDAVRAAGFTFKQIECNRKLMTGYRKAAEEIMQGK